MGGLSFSDRAARSMWRIVPKRAVSGAIGWGVSLGIPAKLRALMLSRFARIYGIDVSEAEKPLEEYAGFDEFFTRKLRPGARPDRRRPGSGRFAGRRHHRRVRPGDRGQIDSGEGEPTSTSPACSTTPQAAARLEGGAYLITYLSPKDYHRVHSPVGGRVVGWRHVPGTLFSVGAASIRREPGLFVRNERFITLIEMDGGGPGRRGDGGGGGRRPRDRLVRPGGRDAPAGVLPRGAPPSVSTTSRSRSGAAKSWAFFTSVRRRSWCSSPAASSSTRWRPARP